LGLLVNGPIASWVPAPTTCGRYVTTNTSWECKNEVKLERENIHKDETGQMNNACGWFDNQYQAKAGRIMIIPAEKCGPGAHFNHEVRIMRPKELKKFKGAIRSFFAGMVGDDLADLSPKRLQELLAAHQLNAEDLLTRYTRPLAE
jgi:hypothetical protein